MNWSVSVQLVFCVSTEVASRQRCCASAQDPWIHVHVLVNWAVWSVLHLWHFCFGLPKRRRGHVPVCPCLVWVLSVGAEPVALLWLCLWTSCSLCVWETHSAPLRVDPTTRKVSATSTGLGWRPQGLRAGHRGRRNPKNQSCRRQQMLLAFINTYKLIIQYLPLLLHYPVLTHTAC